MKVTFTLTPEQLVSANTIVEERRERELADRIAMRLSGYTDKELWDAQDEAHWAGSLLGAMPYFHMLNTDQRLDLDDDQQCPMVSYVGQRHPLGRDGGMSVLLRIAGYESYKQAREDRFSRLTVVEYETSDERMLWWETLDETEARIAAQEAEIAAVQPMPLKRATKASTTRPWDAPRMKKQLAALRRGAERAFRHNQKQALNMGLWDQLDAAPHG